MSRWYLGRGPRYDDGGYSGGSTDRPDLQRLLDDIRARKIDVIVTEVVNIHLASDTTDSSDYLRDRAEDLACDYFKSRKRA